MVAAHRTYYGLQRRLELKLFSRKSKKTLYITLIKPVLLYALETCTLSKADENRLGAFERRILRKIYGDAKKTPGEQDTTGSCTNSTKN